MTGSPGQDCPPKTRPSLFPTPPQRRLAASRAHAPGAHDVAEFVERAERPVRLHDDRFAGIGRVGPANHPVLQHLQRDLTWGVRGHDPRATPGPREATRRETDLNGTSHDLEGTGHLHHLAGRLSLGRH